MKINIGKLVTPLLVVCMCMWSFLLAWLTDIPTWAAALGGMILGPTTVFGALHLLDCIKKK
jgi:hypothetical protein